MCLLAGRGSIIGALLCDWTSLRPRHTPPRVVVSHSRLDRAASPTILSTQINSWNALGLSGIAVSSQKKAVAILDMCLGRSS